MGAAEGVVGEEVAVLEIDLALYVAEQLTE